MSDGSRSRSSSSFHFLAGLTSGLTSAVLLQPADLLKTRVQQSRATTLSSTLRAIAAGPHPIRSLWRGTVPSALRTGFGSALYFTTLNALRTRVATASSRLQNTMANTNTTTTKIGGTRSNGGGGGSSSSLPKLSPTANLLTGALARAGAGFVMMPITVIKVRFESSLYTYTSLASAGLDIARREGLRGFFAGFGATAVRDAPYAGLYVLFYEESKRALGGALATPSPWPSASPSTSSWSSENDSNAAAAAAAAAAAPRPRPLPASTAASVHFASAMVAAALGTALTNPFDAIKTRLQLLPARYKHMGQAARLMVRDEGVRSLFDGLALRMARKAVSSALAWTLYEEFVRRAERAWRVAEGEKEKQKEKERL